MSDTNAKQAIQGKRYTLEEREALIAEYNLSGAAMTAFCKQPGKPSYQVFKKWLDGDDAPKASGSKPSSASSRTGLSLRQEFEATQADAYLAFLKTKASDLRTQLSALEGEIQKLEAAQAE
ncbi:hypothetical protein PS914_03201 [Pseudomonas fluorescens]|uniref:hypothetical protein n=1 Tax=Pseudomonas fluorescens TaxID=294 RepID=UPI001243103C|nr:hypothetical protein [Pseudomonas fluorescens]VVP91820.1 hypothetical protein PS914_03201 [Pseudomonas fluorescens]